MRACPCVHVCVAYCMYKYVIQTSPEVSSLAFRVIVVMLVLPRKYQYHYVCSYFILLFFFWYRTLLCSPSWPWAFGPHTSAPQMLAVYPCTTAPSWCLALLLHKVEKWICGKSSCLPVGINPAGLKLQAFLWATLGCVSEPGMLGVFLNEPTGFSLVDSHFHRWSVFSYIIYFGLI